MNPPAYADASSADADTPSVSSSESGAESALYEPANVLIYVESSTPTFVQLKDLDFFETASIRHDMSQLSDQYTFAKHEGSDMIFIERIPDMRASEKRASETQTSSKSVTTFCGYKFSELPMSETEKLREEIVGLRDENSELRDENKLIRQKLEDMETRQFLQHIAIIIAGLCGRVQHSMHINYELKMIYIIRVQHDGYGISHMCYENRAMDIVQNIFAHKLCEYNKYITYIYPANITYREPNKYKYGPIWDLAGINAIGIECENIPHESYESSGSMFINGALKFDAKCCDIVIIDISSIKITDLITNKIKQVIVGYSPYEIHDAIRYKVYSLASEAEYHKFKSDLYVAGIELIWCYNRYE